uniref:Uncharacterized protein n=1 Tax=Alexandrium monilatum TaxID=311494 RepID=A0A7S4S2X0_9DINO
MGAFDVVALRGICATYFEQHASRILQDLQQAQERLEERLAAQAQDSRTARKQWEGEREQRLEELMERVARLEDPQSRAERGQWDAERERRLEELAGRVARLEEQVVAEDHAQEKKEGEEGEEEEEEAEEGEEEAFVTASLFEGLASRVEELEAQCRALDEELQRKASATNAQLQKLSSLVERKANANKVPSIAQMQELTAAVERKVDANLVPTLAEVKELSAAVKQKADASSVPTVAQLQKLNAAMVELKAGRSQAEQADSLEEVKKLSHELGRKANSHEVPTVAQLEEHAVVVERKLAFLATKVQRLADARDKENMCQPFFWYASPVMTATTTLWEEVPGSTGGISDVQGWKSGSADGGNGPPSGSGSEMSSGEQAPGMWWG